MQEIMYVRASAARSASFGEAVTAVARERKYLASTDGFPPDGTRSFVERVERENLAQFYALDGERVVGWCDILPKPFEGMTHVGVLGMGVLPEYRGKGIGSSLLTMTLAHAKDVNRLEKVELEVFLSNIVAYTMYVKFGFVLEGNRERARKLDGEYDDILQMARFLQPDA